MSTSNVSFQRENSLNLDPYTLDEIKDFLEEGSLDMIDENRVSDTLLRNLIHQQKEILYRIDKQLSNLWRRGRLNG